MPIANYCIDTIPSGPGRNDQYRVLVSAAVYLRSEYGNVVLWLSSGGDERAGFGSVRVCSQSLYFMPLVGAFEDCHMGMNLLELWCTANSETLRPCSPATTDFQSAFNFQSQD